MTRIQKAFDNQKAFIAFVTGGDPDVETTKKLIPEMAKAGADLIEIGNSFFRSYCRGRGNPGSRCACIKRRYYDR